MGPQSVGAELDCLAVLKRGQAERLNATTVKAMPFWKRGI